MIVQTACNINSKVSPIYKELPVSQPVLITHLPIFRPIKNKLPYAWSSIKIYCIRYNSKKWHKIKKNFSSCKYRTKPERLLKHISFCHSLPQHQALSVIKVRCLKRRKWFRRQREENGGINLKIKSWNLAETGVQQTVAEWTMS